MPSLLSRPTCSPDSETGGDRPLHRTTSTPFFLLTSSFITHRGFPPPTFCTRLIHSQSNSLSTNPSPDLEPAPFIDLQFALTLDLWQPPLLEFASLYCGVHTIRGISDSAKSPVVRLFDDCDNRTSTKILLKAQKLSNLQYRFRRASSVQ